MKQSNIKNIYEIDYNLLISYYVASTKLYSINKFESDIIVNNSLKITNLSVYNPYMHLYILNRYVTSIKDILLQSVYNIEDSQIDLFGYLKYRFSKEIPIVRVSYSYGKSVIIDKL